MRRSEFRQCDEGREASASIRDCGTQAAIAALVSVGTILIRLDIQPRFGQQLVHQAHEAGASFGVSRTPCDVGDFARQVHDIGIVGHAALSVNYVSTIEFSHCWLVSSSPAPLRSATMYTNGDEVRQDGASRGRRHRIKDSCGVALPFQAMAASNACAEGLL